MNGVLGKEGGRERESERERDPKFYFCQELAYDIGQVLFLYCSLSVYSKVSSEDPANATPPRFLDAFGWCL